MATRVDHFPVTPRRAQRSYPWHEWTDGGTWMLVRGEDFDAEIEVFRNKLYAQASRRGLKVRTHKEPRRPWMASRRTARCCSCSSTATPPRSPMPGTPRPRR
jgi:hypothetical protein